MKHSRFSASAAHRWAACPGSLPAVNLLRKQGVVPEDSSSPAAEEGTRLHAVLDWCLKNRSYAASWPGDQDDFLTDEQEDVVDQCVEYVRGTPGTARFYDTLTHYGEDIEQSNDVAFGTLDVAILDGATLHVMDAKFGRRYVEAENNHQMILYAIGMFGAIEALGHTVDHIAMHIMQPRLSSGFGEPWMITREELTAWVHKMALAAARVDTAEASINLSDEKWTDFYLKPSEDACQWCPMKAVCPSLKKIAKDAEVIAKGADVSEFDILKLQASLDMVPLLTLFVKAVEEEGFRRLSAGKEVTGYKLVQGRAGNRKWQDESVVVKRLTGLGVDPHTEPGVLTPAQAETALSKALLKEAAEGTTKKEAKERANELLEPLVERSPAKPTMVKEDVAGVPWAGNVSLDDFGV